MLAEKLSTFDSALRERHADVHASLKPGARPRTLLRNPAQDWFAWRDGQPRDTAALFLGRYRFVPFEEAQASARAMRVAMLHPVSAMATLVFARRMLYSWPLLTGSAGEGFYFSTWSWRAFYHFKGEQERVFRSFETFVDFLIELTAISGHTEIARIERELELLVEYTD